MVRREEHRVDRLSDYLDGELGNSERESLEHHLGGCRECTTALEELRQVVAHARALGDLPPATDLWPEVSSRLRPRGMPGPSRIAAWWTARPRVAFTMPQLAAAGLALVVVAVGAVWTVLRFVPPMPSGPDSDATVTRPGTVVGPPLVGGVAGFDESRYDAAVAELERALRENRADLDTATVRVLEQNLEIIDRATEQARRALLADPGNPYLNGHLAEQMRRKIRLLQRATGVVTAQS